MVASPALADDEPAKPAVVRHGWQLDLTGWVQVDSIAWSEESLDELAPDGTSSLLNEERFLIRRGRIRTEAHRGPIAMGFELDGNTIDEPTARILAASVTYTAAGPREQPIAALTAGLFRTPFGMEVPMAERIKPFLEPPTQARALFPGNYDAGVKAEGSYAALRWVVAVMNGAPAFDQQWQGRDPSSSVDVVGRIGAAIDGPRHFKLEAGVSGLVGKGFSPGVAPTKDEIEWIDDNGDGIIGVGEIKVIPGTVGLPSSTFDHDALGADIQASWCTLIGSGWAFFEATLATNLDRGVVYADPVRASRDLRQSGFAIGAVQGITEYARIGVRYDRYDGDRDAIEQQGVTAVGIDKTFSTLSVMATGTWKESRLLVQYDHERNPFGRGLDGMPTTREADRLTIRAQVGF